MQSFIFFLLYMYMNLYFVCICLQYDLKKVWLLHSYNVHVLLQMIQCSFVPLLHLKNSTVDLLFLMTINFIFIAKHQCQFQIYFILQQQSFTTVKHRIFFIKISWIGQYAFVQYLFNTEISHNHFYKLSKVDEHYTVFIKCIIQGLWD